MLKRSTPERKQRRVERIHWILLTLAIVLFLALNDESAHFDDVESQLARKSY